MINTATAAMGVHSYVREKQSMFGAALTRISTIINKDLRDEWGVKKPAHGLIDVENPKDYVRVFSCIQFLFCQPPDAQKDENPIHDLATFGDGWSMANCLIVHCLGMRRRFEISDFSYHIAKLDKYTPVPRSMEIAKPKKGKPLLADQELAMLPGVLELLKRTAIVQNLNRQFFSLLESYLPVPPAQVLPINPPTTVAETKFAPTDKPLMIGAGNVSLSTIPAGAGAVLDAPASPSAGPPSPFSGPPPPNGPPPSSPPPPSGPPPSSPPPPSGPPPPGGPPPPSSPPPPGGPPPPSGPPPMSLSPGIPPPSAPPRLSSSRNSPAVVEPEEEPDEPDEPEQADPEPEKADPEPAEPVEPAEPAEPASPAGPSEDPLDVPVEVPDIVLP